MRKTGCALISLLICASSVTYATTGFQACKDRLIQQAEKEGISTQIISHTLKPASPIQRTLDLDKNQPEFTQTFAAYFNRRITDFRVQQGRKLLKEYQPLLQKLTEEYGVPASYLLAFWGLETNYGSYLGKFPVVDTLITLACDDRRSQYFSNEVMASLKLIEANDLDPEKMLGSWAGAMGQTQFMPTTYLRYGKDGDNNHRIDLWNSIPDALTSAANFLSTMGWEKEWKWGREVKLPKTFDFSAIGLNNKHKLSYWREKGVTTIFGSSIPSGNTDAALLLPSGYGGPAFLVYDNFEVIMGWNRSVFYALTVGHLADRINGSPSLHQPPPSDEPRLTREQIKTLQTKLNGLGFDSGKPDGHIGPATRDAIRAFERSNKMIPDGYPGKELFEALNISLQY
ncbi:Membrane-bound lytic murein transglycosylase B [invertebrate metagenome]|uniref:Membrane-bound lytic murein transglycosylase B n=1 Tax=invertebrate metagenome TaxID=1711999 RepID=A0A2H9T651_9ZZZZ